MKNGISPRALRIVASLLLALLASCMAWGGDDFPEPADVAGPAIRAVAGSATYVSTTGPGAIGQVHAEIAEALQASGIDLSAQTSERQFFFVIQGSDRLHPAQMPTAILSGLTLTLLPGYLERMQFRMHVFVAHDGVVYWRRIYRWRTHAIIQLCLVAVPGAMDPNTLRQNRIAAIQRATARFVEEYREEGLAESLPEAPLYHVTLRDGRRFWYAGLRSNGADWEMTPFEGETQRLARDELQERKVARLPELQIPGKDDLFPNEFLIVPWEM